MQHLLNLYDNLKRFSEDNEAFVWDRLYDVDITQLKRPKQYIVEEAAAIRSEYTWIRVWKVQYWNQRIKKIKTYEDGIVRHLAYCADRDIPVDTMIIP